MCVMCISPAAVSVTQRKSWNQSDTSKNHQILYSRFVQESQWGHSVLYRALVQLNTT